MQEIEDEKEKLDVSVGVPYEEDEKVRGILKKYGWDYDVTGAFFIVNFGEIKIEDVPIKASLVYGYEGSDICMCLRSEDERAEKVLMRSELSIYLRGKI